MPYFLRCAFILLFTTLLMSCAVGPNFHTPPPPETEKYTPEPLPLKTVSTPGIGGQAQHLQPGRDLCAQWWSLFKSPELDALINQGIQNSPNLAAAKAALRQARENLLAQIGSTLFPSVNAGFSAQRQLFSSTEFGTATTTNNLFNLYNASVQVSYVLDVFGGARREIESMQALVNYQAFELEAAYLALTTNIVTAAITMASLRDQIYATRDLLSQEEKQLDILRKQFELGGVSIADVLSQQTLAAQTRATIPPLEIKLSNTRHVLAVLVGELPSESHLPDFALEKLSLPIDIPLSMPSLLVKQRPDIRAAEALLHQASAQIGVATANLFPQFTINGNDGSQTNHFRNLFMANTNVWSITGQVLQPVFHGGALLAARRAAIDAYQQSLAQYRQVVLQGFANVADTLDAIGIDAKALQAQDEAERAALHALELTRKQFKLGAVNYLFLLNAERQYQQTRINRIQAQAARLTDTAAFFQALGGGWWNREMSIFIG